MNVAPPNFGMVEERIFRCGLPEARSFPFLDTLRLRTCIVLAAEPPRDLLVWLAENGVAVVQPANIAEYKSHAVPEHVVIELLQLLLNEARHPILLTCAMGRHRTGTIVGCFRKLQRWNTAAIVEEYRRHAGSKARLENEEFIELFDTDLVRVPRRVGRDGVVHLPGVLYGLGE